MADERTVVLGDDTYLVAEARHTWMLRLKRTLGADMDDVLGRDVSDVEGLLGVLGAKVYDVLAVFIPDLQPRWKFMGYATQEAMDTGAYDPGSDRAPTTPQILDAVEAMLDLNGMSRMSEGLGKILGPEMTSQLRTQAARFTGRLDFDSLLSSPRLSGTSGPTSSGPSSPTGPAGPSD